MQVPIVNIVSYDNRNLVQKTKIHKAPAFRGYGESIANVVKRDLTNVTQVSSAFRELLNSLKSTPGVIRSSDLTTLENNGFGYDLAGFMVKISAPIAKVE